MRSGTRSGRNSPSSGDLGGISASRVAVNMSVLCGALRNLRARTRCGLAGNGGVRLEPRSNVGFSELHRRHVGLDRGLDSFSTDGESLISLLQLCLPTLAVFKAGDSVDAEDGDLADPLPAKINERANDDDDDGTVALGDLAREHQRGDGLAGAGRQREDATPAGFAPGSDGGFLIGAQIQSRGRSESGAGAGLSDLVGIDIRRGWSGLR